MLKDLLKLALSLLVSHTAGIIGGVFTAPAIPGWYANLKKPPFTPPAWVFAPAWLTLFTLIGLALFLVWRRSLTDPKVRTALTLFAAQWVLNILWSFLFFGLKSPAFALVEITGLWLVAAATLISFYRVSTVAGLLLVPYLSWIGFAVMLNYYVWRLNV